MSYDDLEKDYDRQIIDHLECYARGQVHTNGLENFWALLKRALKGTYVNVEPFHLFRYCDEQAFRFNERKDNDQGRFIKALSGVVGRTLNTRSSLLLRAVMAPVRQRRGRRSRSRQDEESNDGPD